MEIYKLKVFCALFAMFSVLVVTSSTSIAMGKKIAAEQRLTGTWRYKLTVTVETPEGIKSGFAVRQVNWQLEPRPEYRPHPYHPIIKVKGEAVAVDLGSRGMLFALLDTDDYRLVFHNFTGPPGLTPDGLAYYTNLKNVKKVLNPEVYPGYPTLVTFTDINNPLSIKLAMKWKSEKTPPYPQTFSLEEDNFERLFGKGVKLKQISLEMTDEPVTWTVQNTLKWLDDYRNKRLDGNRFGTIKATNHLANSLASGAFSTGENKDE